MNFRNFCLRSDQWNWNEHPAVLSVNITEQRNVFHATMATLTMTTVVITMMTSFKQPTIVRNIVKSKTIKNAKFNNGNIYSTTYSLELWKFDRCNMTTVLILY